MTITYATVDQIYAEQPPVLETSVTTTQVQDMLEYGQAVAAKFDRVRGFEFAPRVATKYHNVVEAIFSGRVIGYLFYLDEPLLAVTTVTLGDGTVLVENTDYRLHPRGETPAYALRMINTSKSWAARDDSTSDISILGKWGWHNDYTRAWVDSDDHVQDVSVTATQLTIITTDADGRGTDGLIPRFSPGNMIRIDSEYMSVMSISSQTLTVVRGIRGSTSATHTNGTQIDVFKPDSSIVRAAKRQTVYDLSRAGKFTRVTFEGVGIETTPDVIPEVQQILDNIPFVGWWGGG